MNYSKKLKDLLSRVIKERASDLHISVPHPPTLRITGNLIPLSKEKEITPEEAGGLARELMTELQWKKFMKNKEVDFSYGFEEKARFRVNVFYQRGNISIAMRLIPYKIKTIEELNLPPVLHEFTTRHQGLVLITGASSQGKSTTLAALIDEINKSRGVHIVTIEDPIEYIFKDDKAIINQREVFHDTLSFNRALVSVFREDPDVIMVGEMRDLNTISNVITAAETGHLVFATLHTNSAAQTIHRVVDVFPPGQQNQIRLQLSGSLLGVVSQRLVPSIEGGFVPACEIMFANSAVATLIRENKTHEIPTVIETSGKQGMISLNRSLAELVRKKKISLKNAINYSLKPSELRNMLK